MEAVKHLKAGPVHRLSISKKEIPIEKTDSNPSSTNNPGTFDTQEPELQAVKPDDPTENDTARRSRNWAERYWEWHMWIQGQPWDEEDNSLAPFVIYVLFFCLAWIPIYDILKYESTYTDVQIETLTAIPLWAPDAVVCPPKNSCPMSLGKNCPSGPPFFKNMSRECICHNKFIEKNLYFDIWWDTDMVLYFNISAAHLNLLASIVHKQDLFGVTENIPKELLQYLHKAALMLQKIDNPQIIRVSNVSGYLNSTIALNRFWHLLIQPNHKFGPMQEYFEPNNNNMNNMKRKTTWVQNAYCSSFENVDRNGKGNVNNSLTTATLSVFQLSRYWLGDIKAINNLNLSHFMEFTDDFSFRVELVIYRTYTEAKSEKKKCSTQNQTLLSLNLSKNCANETKWQEYLYIIHSPTIESYGYYGPYGKIRFLFNLPVWVISKHKVYSKLASFELIMSIFGLFIGLSLYQVLSIFAKCIAKWKRLASIGFKSIILVALLSISSFVFYNDLTGLLADQYVHKVHLEATLPIPEFRVTVPLNFAKIEELNISWELLQYVHLSSTGTLGMLNRISADLTKTGYNSNPLFSENLILSTEERLKELDNEYALMAKKMGYHTAHSSYKLFEELHVDKCQYVVFCQINGEELENCCNYFNYSLQLELSHPVMFLSLNNSNRRFGFRNSQQTHVHVRINMSYAGIENVIKYANTRGNLTARITSQKTKGHSISQMAYFDGVVYIPFCGVDLYGFDMRKGQEVEITISQMYTKQSEIDRESAGHCTNNKKCHWDMFGMLQKNAYILISCGCLICHIKETKELAFKKQCCSPKMAVRCLTNPLLEKTHIGYKTCSESDMCNNGTSSKTNDTCGPSPLNLHYNYMINDDIKWHEAHLRRLQFSFFRFCLPTHPFVQKFSDNYSARLIDIINSLKCEKYSAVHHGPPYCMPGKPGGLCSNENFKVDKNFLIKEKVNDDTTDIKLHLEKSSTLKNLVESRDTRRYSLIEVFGIILGGLGLFLGVDVLSILESIVRYLNSKQKSFCTRLEESLKPIHLHLMRIFHNIKIKRQMVSRNEDNNKEPLSTNIYVAFFIATMLLLLTGTGISTFAAMSNLLSVTEYNLEIEKETAQNLPSFTFCWKAKPEEKNAFNKRAVMAYLSTENIRCYYNMTEKPCSSLFELYLFSDGHHCWATGGKLIDYTMPGGFHEPNTFPFMFAHIGRIETNVWFGNIYDVFYGRIFPQPVKRSVVFNYQILRNESLTNEIKNICPICEYNYKGSLIKYVTLARVNSLRS